MSTKLSRNLYIPYINRQKMAVDSPTHVVIIVFLLPFWGTPKICFCL